MALLALAMPATAAAGELGKLALDKAPIDLLGGRLALRFPAGARIEARGRSIMAAPESAQHETRVVLEKGDEKLVVTAVEFFALVGPDFEQQARKDLGQLKAKGGAPYGVAPLVTGSPKQRALAATSPALDLERKGQLVVALFLAHVDGTVQWVGFAVNPAAGKDAAGCTALIKRMVATLAPGARALPRAAGVRSLDVLAKETELQATVPAGWVATVQPGPDFIVHHLRKLTPYGAPTVGFSVYVGGHPSYQHRQVDGPAPKVTTTKGKLLGKDVEWQRWQRGTGKDAATTHEAIAPLPGNDRLRVHVFASVADGALLKEIQPIIATLKVGPKAKKGK
ncbi:MAG: hypothetical protein HY906_28425 [Deltaproteobacteria bacterium]|nr:hypothetical protein [Deltaproteobacteria bacterium]